MAKRLVCKVGTYQKDGEEKGEYVKVGVILSSENGEYALLDPTINMAGIAFKQRVNGISKADSDSVIASIFDDSNQGAPSRPQSQPAQANDFNDDLPDSDVPF